MSDEELIARLRESQSYEWQDPIWETRLAAADRIEALTAKVKLMDDLDAINGEKIEALTAELNTCRMAQVVMDNTVAELEAKLAKAVEGQKIMALEQILEERCAVFDAMVDAAEDAAGKDVSFNVVVGRALRAAIAEIKGESHDPTT